MKQVFAWIVSAFVTASGVLTLLARLGPKILKWGIVAQDAIDLSGNIKDVAQDTLNMANSLLEALKPDVNGKVDITPEEIENFKTQAKKFSPEIEKFETQLAKLQEDLKK